LAFAVVAQFFGLGGDGGVFFSNNRRFRVFEPFRFKDPLTGSGYLKTSKSKNHQFQLFPKPQTVQGFMKEPAKEPAVFSRQVLDGFKPIPNLWLHIRAGHRTTITHPSWAFDLLRTTITYPIRVFDLLRTTIKYLFKNHH
jgi:hypothetical protein